MPMSKGKKSSSSSLGRSLVRKKRQQIEVSSRHSTNDAETGGSVSVTETTSIDDFLSNAEAAQRSFQAERGKASVANLGVVDEAENECADQDDDEEEGFCSIPKKPDWKEAGSGEEYRQLEVEAFLKWKRQLSALQARYPKLPPFEKNLDFWRQLWRIVEMSEVVVQVVDARDPLFYYSHDLAQYVADSCPLKCNVVLLNKADFLTEAQRVAWASYFRHSDMKAIFFSAVADTENCEQLPDDLYNSPHVYTPAQVVQAFRLQAKLLQLDTIKVGFLGYPNVGKSSSINRLLNAMKVKVSATPGKTKHLQTHVIDGGDVVVIDGPGLVIPDLRMTKAHMVLGGILPIDTLSEPLPCVELLLQKVPFHFVTDHYGILRSQVMETLKQDRKSTQGLQLLSSLATLRGFMKPGGVPDQYRAAQLVLKDYVTGRLVFCQAPPGFSQDDFSQYPDGRWQLDDDATAALDLRLEDSFPELRVSHGAHVRGWKGQQGAAPDGKRHGNKNKREKLRRLYKDRPYE